MSGFGGRIAIEGDTARGKRLLGTAIKFANKQRQSKNILGQTSSIKTYDLGGGAYCTVVDLAHMRSIQIVAPPSRGFEYEYIDVFPEGGDGPGVYDVLAGFTNDPVIEKETTTDSKGKKTTITAIQHFKPTLRTNLRHPKDQYRRSRLAVQENSIFVPVTPPGEKVFIYSEHAHIKPTNYTGPMREVVQLILGLGKILRPTAEEAMHLPRLPWIGKDLVTDLPRQMISAFGLYDKKESPFTPRVDFDYRVSKTHGVTFDQNGVAWVIEIGFRGVHAMKLYMDPVSMTYEGATRWAKVSPELSDFILKFGGIPLGITFPNFELFDKYKRAGEVVELISESAMRDFYSKVPMSSDTGWSFSQDGKQAHNTCWDWGLDEIKTGWHFGISISLLADIYGPWTPKRSELAAKFNTIYEVNKCRRMNEENAEDILDEYAVSVERGYKKFDELVVGPSLVGSAKMAMQRKGRLYHPGLFRGQPQIKFPEHIVGALLSFDFSASSFPRKDHKVKCDTPMYVCHIDGNLEVICYAFDNTKPEAPAEPIDETSRQECQFAGSWTSVTSPSGAIRGFGHFYSNRWDFRREQRMTAMTVTEGSASKIGVWPSAGSEFLLSTIWYAWTNIAVMIETAQTSYPNPPTLELACSAVMRDRNAYYFAKMNTQYARSATQYSGHVEVYQGKQRDEWSVYHFLYAWVGGPHCPWQDWIDPAPMDCIGRKRCIHIDEGACFDDNVHQDFWINACSPGPGWSAGFESANWPTPTLPSGYSYSGPAPDGQVISDVHFVNDTPHGEVLAKHLVETTSHGSSLSSWWWKASPDDAGNMPTIQAVNSCLGEPVTNYMNDMDGDVRWLGGPEYMRGSWISCYTGVIE